MAATDTVRIDFICVHNAGRSQMAAAFAERERAERGLEEVVEIHSGGTDPADEIHSEVVDAMAEEEFDLSDRSPSWVVLDDLKDSHYLVTMGCSITEFNPAQYGVESRAWDLTNPDGKDMETVREVRDEIERRVSGLFDEIERTAAESDDESESVTARVSSAVRDALSF
ncbi:MAG: low molecular weight phosphatase family protein [Halobacteriales archaeon SW_9_67_25]|nr:MAG: low molecular weight phosphatase family protein [Halobacteriales archaeon SW_9_67_25]